MISIELWSPGAAVEACNSALARLVIPRAVAVVRRALALALSLPHNIISLPRASHRNKGNTHSSCAFCSGSSCTSNTRTSLSHSCNYPPHKHLWFTQYQRSVHKYKKNKKDVRARSTPCEICCHAPMVTTLLVNFALD